MAGSPSDSDSEIEEGGTITAGEGTAMSTLKYAIFTNDIDYLTKKLGSLSVPVDYYKDRPSPIYLAVETGNLKVLEMLITAKFDVDVGTKSPLYYASSNGNAEVVRMLLDAGANPNKARTDNGVTPLWIASYNGHAEVVEILLGARADPNKARTDNGGTPLFTASIDGNTEVVRMLIDAEADPNKARTDNGVTPLCAASEDGHAEVVKILLDAGANPNKTSRSNGVTPVYAASRSGHAEVVKMLIDAEADPNKAKTDTGGTPLITASTSGRAKVVEMLLGAGADPNKALTNTGDTPLYGASSYGHAKVVEMLLRAEADPNKATTDNGTTPLFIASQEGYAEVVKMLLDAGADPNKATTDEGQTPVYAASRDGHAELVRMLLGAGADPDKATTSNATPLSIASSRGYAEVVKILLGNGADPNKARTDGVTPLFFASQNGHPGVVKMLLGAGAVPNKARTDDGTTPLYIASQEGHADVVKMLLDAGADPNIARTDDGTTPLMNSVLQASDDAALAVVKLLAMAGAVLAHVDNSNRTAVMIAQNRNLPKTVAWLNSVANLNQVQIIVALGNEDVLRKILRQGEIDLFSRDQGTPSITDLAAAVDAKLKRSSMRRLVTEAKLRWAPVRHGLFHPAHRSTAYCILLVAKRPPNRLGLGRDWVSTIPTEVWFIIIEWLGRSGWPKKGRLAQLQLPSPGSGNVQPMSTDFTDRNNLDRIGVANVFHGEYLFSPDVAAEFEDFMKYAKKQKQRIDTTPILKNAETLRLAMDDIIEAAKEIKSGIQFGKEEKKQLLYECEETIEKLLNAKDFTKKVQKKFLEEHRIVEDLMGV